MRNIYNHIRNDYKKLQYLKLLREMTRFIFIMRNIYNNYDYYEYVPYI